MIIFPLITTFDLNVSLRTVHVVNANKALSTCVLDIVFHNAVECIVVHTFCDNAVENLRSPLELQGSVLGLFLLYCHCYISLFRTSLPRRLVRL